MELVFWTTEIHEDRLVVIDFLAKAFGAMQDDVTVKVVSKNENELTECYDEAVEAGNAPHLIGTGSEILVAMAETGSLDIDAASRVVDQIGRERFYTGALNMLAVPGGERWYGIPFHGWVQGIWYRADWFKEAGLKPPCSWSDILAAARHFTDPDKGRYGILVGTGLDHFTTQVFTQIAMANSAAMFNSDGSVVFDEPAMVEALEFYVQLARCTPPGAHTWRTRDYFLQGKMAMMFYSTFIMDDLALEVVASNSLTGNNFSDLVGAEFDPNLVRNVSVMPFVCRKVDAGYGMINGFGVRQGLSAEELKALGNFLKFLYQPPQYVTWLHMAPGGMLPVLRDVADTDLFLADPFGLFRRYGRSKIKKIMGGLTTVKSFGMVDGRRQPAASVVYDENVIPRMIDRTVFKGVPAARSVAIAAEEIRQIAKAVQSYSN